MHLSQTSKQQMVPKRTALMKILCQTHPPTQSNAHAVVKVIPSTNARRLPVSLQRTRDRSYSTTISVLAALEKGISRKTANKRLPVKYVRNIIQRHYMKTVHQQIEFQMFGRLRRKHLPCLAVQIEVMVGAHL